MAITVTDFKARYPQFSTAEDALIEASLAQAAREIDLVICGDQADDIQALRAAQDLSSSPFGIQAGLATQQGNTYVTAFDQPLERRLRAIGTAYRLILP